MPDRSLFTWVARAVLASMLLGSALPACGKKPDDGTAPTAGESLPALTIRDDTPNLLLTWIDSKGDSHVELHPPDVPAEGRSLVRVVVSDREDGTRDLFYVADLGQKQGDGSYGTRTMSRREWEATIEARRREYLAKVVPQPPPTGAPAPSSSAGEPPKSDRPPVAGLTVIIYGADWCKPCHQAADYLKRIGVPHVVKDVEEDEAAAREMSEKLAKAGRRGSSIPVIDVGGQILVGFSKSELDRAIKRASQGTVL